MCGIIYVKRVDGKGAFKMVNKRYFAQKSRGSDGFGFLSLSDGKLENYKRAEKESDILKSLELHNTSEVIFHHRYPTSTPNFEQSAHPIKVSHASLKHDYYVVHNGVITNDDTLKRKHEELGFVYNTEITREYKSHNNTIFVEKMFNDSESLAIELALNINEKGEGVDTMGSVAFIALQVDKGGNKARRLFFGRNSGSPLKIKMADNFITITSEGEGNAVEENKLFCLEYTTNKVTVRDFKVGKPYSASNYGYDYSSGYSSRLYDDVKDDYSYNDQITGEILDEEEYYDALTELNEIQKQIASKDVDGMIALEFEDRRLELEEMIKRYETLVYSKSITT